MSKILTIFTSVVVLFSRPVSAEDDQLFFRLEAETAACISQHQDQLSEGGPSLIYVYPPTCPTSPKNPLSVFTTAEAPDITATLKDDDLEPDKLLILSRDQLRCFEDLPLLSAEALYRFYPDNCEFREEQ